MKKLKLKFEQRISFSFVILFVFLMLTCTFFVTNFLKLQENANNKIIYSEKIIELNNFLDKLESFATKYNTLTLEFNPKIENQTLVFPQPFESGKNNFSYILRVRNNEKFDEIALNTFNSNLSEAETKSIINNINKIITKDKVNNNEATHFTINSNSYMVIRLSRVIGGNLFDIYTFKNVTYEYNTYKTLFLILLIYTIIAVLFVLLISKTLSRRMLNPVNNIINTAKSISYNDLSLRIEKTETGDELDNLIEIINNMLERLNIAFDNQSKFISDVSHELRTPLAIIKGYAELMKRHSNLEDEISKESIELIIQESVNMKNLVDKLLFLARGDANTVKLSIETFASHEFIKQVSTDSAFFAKNHNVIIEKNEKYTLLADKSLLLQALRTLIENSVKYSPKDSNIYINSYYDSENKEAVISIRDEGIGIEEKYFEKIFERFYRVDESRTKGTGGTGLGLSIVKKIITIHNGRIGVESELNKGTKFTLYIPSKLKN